jgi:hypothetical protein
MDESAASDFIAVDWGQSHRHWPGALSAASEFRIDLDGLEAALSRLNRAHEGWLHFADLDLQAVSREFVGPEGLLDMRKVAAAFAAGKTLYLTKADCLMEPLAQTCIAMEADLAHFGIALRDKVNVHVFLTPRQCRGFAPHRDAHASFILQCEGSKHWEIYRPPDDETAAHQRGGVSTEILANHEQTRVTLRPGDLLYIPEWWPHAATASDTHSLHVTLRVFPLRYCDLISAFSERAATLAGALPPGADPGRMTAQRLIDLLAGTRLRDELLRDFSLLWNSAAQAPRPPRQIGLMRSAVEAERIDLDTPLSRDPGTTCEVQVKGDSAELSFANTRVRGPGLFRQVFVHVSEHARLRARDLPEIDAHYDKLEIVRRLVREGLLRAEDPA